MAVSASFLEALFDLWSSQDPGCEPAGMTPHLKQRMLCFAAFAIEEVPITITVVNSTGTTIGEAKGKASGPWEFKPTANDAVEREP